MDCSWCAWLAKVLQQAPTGPAKAPCSYVFVLALA
jgi:hypothetical protein